MSIASIDITQMRDLVRRLSSARTSIQRNREDLARTVLDVDLTSPRLLRLMGVEAWIDDQLPGIRRRLAVAEAIEAQTPGMQAVVEVDESLISDSTEEEAREDARRAAELITEHGIMPGASQEVLDQHGIPEELLELLSKNAFDPYFAQELALQTSPEDVAAIVTAAAQFRDTVAGSSGVVLGLDEYDLQYEALLSGLGETLGLATRATDDMRLPKHWRDAWLTAATDYDLTNLPSAVQQANALSLVMSRGTWGTVLVHDVTAHLFAIEKQFGSDAWTMTVSGLTAPGGDLFNDPLAGALAAVATNPEVAQWLFDDTTVRTVEIHGTEVVLDGFLEHCLRREWPSDDGAALMAALETATTPFEGGSTVSADIATNARALVEQITAEHEEAQREAEAADKGWFSNWGHAILDVIGLVPLLGEPADGVNAIWYTAEGNYVDAGLSAAGMLPVAGWIASSGKWTRRALSADELATLGRQLDGTVVDAATVRGPTGPPTGGVFQRQKPEWVERMLRGKEFEGPILDEVVAAGGNTQMRVMQPVRDANGKIVLDANGKPLYRDEYPYNIVDGYMHGDQIIEVKNTQFAEVSEAHGLSQLRALADKYPPGTPIADVPSTPAGLGGRTLDGEMVLVVPVQNGDIPQKILDRARELEITIRDSAGKEYT